MLSFVGGSGNEDGQRSGLNDLGQLAFWAEFTNGTQGVFVSNAVAVPEPAALAMVVCLAAVARANSLRLFRRAGRY